MVLLTTAHRGTPNVMTMSWHMMIDFEPPLVGLIVSNRNYSFDALVKTKECVINIPTIELAKEVVGCGNTTGLKIDKFKKFGLTPITASEISPPLIAECFANLECKVADTKMVKKYNLFVVQVLKAWVNPNEKHPKTLHHAGAGIFRVAGQSIRLPSRMK